jgi:hypothetical protein
MPEIDISNQMSGIYFINIQSGDSRKTLKFIKQ